MAVAHSAVQATEDLDDFIVRSLNNLAPQQFAKLGELLTPSTKQLIQKVYGRGR